ncbi:MAG TPA: hypothetical protein VF021_08660 [Longimicrobiales bacterium]
MRIRFAVVLTVAVALAACNDGLGPQPWDATPDTVSLYTASRPDLLGLPSGYDFVNLTPVRVEANSAAGNWDVVLTGQGPMQMVPAGAFQGQTSRAGIATITNQGFDALAKAPTDTAAFSAQPVTLAEGGVYVVRSRRAPCSFSTAVHYAKVLVLRVDAASGLVRMAVVRNPYCNDRSFVPPTN